MRPVHINVERIAAVTRNNNVTDNPATQAPLLSAHGLWRRYDTHVAVRDLDIELTRGDVLGFLGPNGAGKSTTMQMLSGNLAPSSGSISIAGIDLLEEPTLAKRRLGYLPEIPPLYPEMTLLEYLDFCGRLHGMQRKARQAAIERVTEQCDLGEMRHRLIGNLSKGYQQRVGIAQAVLHDPEVVILDEPTVGLDPIQIRDIRALIRQLGEQHAVILSTHILPEVQEVCSRVLIINHGRAVFESSLADLAHGAPNSVRISGSALPDDDTLRSFDTVESIQRIGSDTVIVGLNGDPAALLETAVNSGWGIREFTPEQRTLEQVFVEITSRDVASTSHDVEDAA
jgi:ABC-2 type transport system ATP-binding protein